MTQYSFGSETITNLSFPATRTALNAAIQALASNSSGDADPSVAGTTVANQWWYETDTNILKIRNEANNGWVDVITLDASMTASASELNQLDAITRGSILYGNASGATARLAKGAAGTVLTSDGTDISWAAGGGGMEFIASLDASSSATLSFTGFDASKYDSYIFTVGNMLPATDDTLFQALMSVDGGSNYLSASDSYVTGIAVGISAGDNAFIPLTYNGIGNATGEGLTGDYFLNNPDLNTTTYLTGSVVYTTATGAIGGYIGDQFGAGKTKAATVVNAIQFKFSSGNIASGTITMYGRVNS